MKRKSMSKGNSRKVFKKGTRVNGKNGLSQSGSPSMRGGIRL